MSWFARFFVPERRRAIWIRAANVDKTCGSPESSPPEAPSLDPVAIRNAHPEAAGIISTCLYGFDKPAYRARYLEPLLRTAPQWRAALPGWRYRVYVPADVPADVVEELVGVDAEVYVMGRAAAGSSVPTMWRFLPGDAPDSSNFKPFFVVDADSKFSARKAAEIEAWTGSGRPYYQQSQIYTLAWPMSAASWGAQAPIPGLKENMRAFAARCDCFGCDERFLSKHVYGEFAPGRVYGADTAALAIGKAAAAVVAVLLLALAVGGLVAVLR